MVRNSQNMTTSRSNAITEDDHHHHNQLHGGGSTQTGSDDLPKLIGQELDYLEKSFEEAKRRVDLVITQITDARLKFSDLLLRQGERTQIEMDLLELKRKLGKLKSKIPSNLITPDDEPNPNVNWRHRTIARQQEQTIRIVHDQLVDKSGRIPSFDDDEHPIPEYLNSSLDELNSSPKAFPLWVFLVFPEKAILRKGLMLHWMRTNTVTPYRRKSFFKEIIDSLIEDGCIKPIYNKSTMSLCGYSMHPFVRATLKDGLRVKDSKYLVSSMDEDDTIYFDSAKFSAMKDLEFLHLGK